MKPEFIVTYGENNSVGKEMLRRRLISYGSCQVCRILYTPTENDPGECLECRDKEGLLPWSSPSGS